MNLVLDDIETRVLQWALQKYLPELRYEAARIKLPRDRHDLVLKEQVLSILLERLTDSPGAAAAPP
jgi:hypothetical protein